jgi:hypothetical protein
MTTNKWLKRAARKYAAEHGTSYVQARRLLAEGSQPASPDASDVEGNLFEERPMSIHELIEGAPQGTCDELVGEPIHPTHERSDGIALDMRLPSTMTEPTVHQFDIPDVSADIQVDETFDGGTLACNVTASGMLTVEALMAKADAINASEAGEVDILEADFNRHYSSVLFDVDVDVTFEAIINPESESVEDFRFVGAVVTGP